MLQVSANLFLFQKFAVEIFPEFVDAWRVCGCTSESWSAVTLCIETCLQCHAGAKSGCLEALVNHDDERNCVDPAEIRLLFLSIRRRERAVNEPRTAAHAAAQ